jgi:hypothetical protein
MNKKLLFVLAGILMVAVLAFAGCAGSTQTVTLVLTDSKPPTGPNVTTVTITQTLGTQVQTSAVVLAGAAPKIPHGSTVEGMYGMCFDCHPIPAGHTGRIANQSLCSTCHEQGEYILAQ